MHALNAIAVLGVLPSGIETYRAAPFFPVTFPAWMSLGGDMKGVLRWHFSLMGVLVISAAAYTVWRWGARHRLVPMTPLSPREPWRDTSSALLGGYELTRRIHFLAMSGVLLFVVVHIVMALLVPRTLASISVGLESKAK